MNHRHVNTVVWAVCICAQLSIYADSASHAAYKHAESWQKEFPECGGKRQSPINLRNKHAQKVRRAAWDRRGWSFFGYNTHKIKGYDLTRNGIDYEHIEGVQPGVKGPGLKGKYCLANVHFHWGKVLGNKKSYEGGSEHKFFGKQRSIEMHLVHYKCSKYSSLQDALDYYKRTKSDKEALAVLGFMLEPSDRSPFRGSPLALAGIMLKKVRRVAKTSSFWRYQGSLTTPPCYETVVWSLFRRAIKLETQSLLNLRRYLAKKSNTLDSVRPVQTANDKKSIQLQYYRKY